MNYFVFNGKSSLDYGVYISGSGTFNGAERDVEAVEVPGRNGDLIIDNGRFKNVPLVYPAFIAKGMPEKVEGLRAMLSGTKGYCRIEDTYHTDEYRLGYYTGGLEVSPSTLNVGGNFDIAFMCKPQRFLRSGESSFSLTADGTVMNPTGFPAKPLLRVYGTGTVEIGDIEFTINTATGYTDIDCEIMEAYKGQTNCNANVTLPDEIYLSAGSNSISLGGSVTQLDITPRWWIL